MSKTRPNVALIIETSSAHGRQILNGVAQYQRAHGGWSVLLNEGAVRGIQPQFVLDTGCDGMLCRSTSPEWLSHLRGHDLAIVDLNDRFGYVGLPRVSSDMLAIGRMAADHLLERGFRHIAFCGHSDEAWSQARLQGVRSALHERGELCGIFESRFEMQRQAVWQQERDEICAWLQTLPRPVGIVACNDARGHTVLDACRLMNLAVPEEVAVVGVDNAETFCELCDPPLSSVVPNGQRIGYEAAAMLDGIMAGQPPEKDELLISPLEVITRQSSDVFAINDLDIANALRFIREQACNGISIADVLHHATLSRSSLERGFRSFLGHSPQEEIRQVRLKRVKHLLAETNWSIPRIAHATGFDYPNYLMVQFKRSTGQTPSQWREANRSLLS
jgi:LacI family transcriptional regulator